MKHSIEYTLGKYQLTINFWFFIIFILIQTGLNELGFWQLSRAQEKQIRLELLNNKQPLETDNLKEVNQVFINEFGIVNLQVNLFNQINLLIENKIQNGNLGYHVLNLVEDKNSGKVVLVNRGWINGTANRNDIPLVKLPTNHWEVEARVYQINKNILSNDAELESYGNVLRLPVLDSRMHSLLEKRFNVTIEPYILRSTKNTSDVFDIDWAWISMTPDKHLGYAFQWFGLALTFLIISIFALVKKIKKT